MEIGDIFDKFEEDSKNLVLTALLCFPVAFIDCWKISPTFAEIELIPQIIIAVGIALMLAFGGILNNLFYLILSGHTDESIYPVVSIIPAYATSITVLLMNRKFTPISFELIFVGLCAITLGIALFTRISKNRCKNKSNNERTTDGNDL